MVKLRLQSRAEILQRSGGARDEKGGKTVRSRQIRGLTVGCGWGWAVMLCLVAAGAESGRVGHWEITAGQYRIAAPGSNFYYFTEQPYLAGEGTVEATVVVRKRVVGGGWATAGLVLALGPSSFWHFGLVEGPDGRRYTELVEDLSGVHQAQGQGAGQLSPLEGAHGAEWQYGTVYLLRLTLTRERIVGEVYRAGGGQPVARHGYLFTGAPAVREGWAGLRCDAFEAEFSGVKISAPAAAPTGPVRSYPRGRRGTVGLYFGSDLPQAPPPPKLDGLRKRLAEAGFACVELTSADLISPGALAYPALTFLAADLRRLPAPGVEAIMAWMRQGGILVSLAAPAFGRLYFSAGGRWMEWEEYLERVFEPQAVQGRPVVAWTAEELARWGQSSSAGVEASAEVQAAAAPGGQDVLHLTVPHFSRGWWSLGRAFAAPPAQSGETLTCFWAKGDVHTPALSVEWAEQDGSRWVATVTLQPTWRFYCLPPAAFVYWPDNPSQGRGMPGDYLRLARAVRLIIGVSSSHTPAVLAQEAREHHIYITAPTLAQAPPTAALPPGPPVRPDLEALSPGYKLHEIKAAVRCQPTAVGRLWGLSMATLPLVPALGAVERATGAGFTGARWWRWVPLVEVRDGQGGSRGVPFSAVISGAFPLPHSVWLSWGLTNLADLERPPYQAALVAALQRLADAPVLYEGGAEGFLMRPGEPLALGARVASFSQAPFAGLVKFAVAREGSGKVIASAEAPVQLRPLESAVVRRRLPGLEEGDYRLTVELTQAGRVLDRIVQMLQVRPRLSSPPPAQEIVVRRGGGLYLAGKPWHPVACNYAPHHCMSIGAGAATAGFLSPGLYDPAIIEADLAQMEAWGFRALAAVWPDPHWLNAPDVPAGRNCEDFLWRCHRHHLKVIVFCPGLDPRGRDENLARWVIESVRNHPALAGYDIAWEPHYYRERHRYAPQWRAWLVAQYGSLEAAATALGHDLPRDEQGAVTVPPDQWCTQEGPWRGVTAAYYAYMNWQLGAEYRRSVGFVRSLDPWHLVGFRGSNVVGPGLFKPVEQPAVLHFVDWAGPEGYDVPVYGRLTDWPWVSSRGLVTRMLSFLSGGKPVVWMEFGAPVYPNGTTWQDELVYIKPDRYEYQAEEARRWLRMQAESGAWGSFIWWYPGGFRVGENSDCGLVDPDNTPRPVAAVMQEFQPKFAFSESFVPDCWLEFKPESNIGGWVGEYVRLREEYARLTAAGHRVGVKTAGEGMTSGSCPLVDPAGRPWPGKGPLRYLDALFERVRVRAANGPWQEVELPTSPEPVQVAVEGEGPVELEAWAANLAEPTWLAAQGEAEGAVVLSVSGDTNARLPLERPVEFQGSGHFGPARVPGTLAPNFTLRLQLAALGRASFGEILHLVVRRR
jgi:hypothetical protein